MRTDYICMHYFASISNREGYSVTQTHENALLSHSKFRPFGQQTFHQVLREVILVYLLRRKGQKCAYLCLWRWPGHMLWYVVFCDSQKVPNTTGTLVLAALHTHRIGTYIIYFILYGSRTTNIEFICSFYPGVFYIV